MFSLEERGIANARRRHLLGCAMDTTRVSPQKVDNG